MVSGGSIPTISCSVPSPKQLVSCERSSSKYCRCRDGSMKLCQRIRICLLLSVGGGARPDRPFGCALEPHLGAAGCVRGQPRDDQRACVEADRAELHRLGRATERRFLLDATVTRRHVLHRARATAGTPQPVGKRARPAPLAALNLKLGHGGVIASSTVAPAHAP